MKPAGVPELALLLLCCAVTLVLFFFSLLPSVSEDQSFLGSTYELIMKAKSSPVFVFLICNLIVVAILLENSTSSLRPDFELFGSISPSEHVGEEDKGEANDNDDEEEEEDEDEDEDEDEYFHGYDGYEEDNDDEGSEDDDSDSDGEGDDDLEIRIEEFIAKINRAWRAERLGEKEMLPA